LPPRSKAKKPKAKSRNALVPIAAPVPRLTFTDAIAKEVCTRILLGKTIRQIAAEDGMPAERTIYDWLGQYPAFAHQYARAREESAHGQADQVSEVAADVRDGKLEPDRGRVVIDALKWAAGKRKPKVYGDKLELAGDKENPLHLAISGLKDNLGKKLDRIDRTGEPVETQD
jgi:hypothetical protein